MIADQWQEIFDAHEIDFGNDEDSVYTPEITLWALISQAFFKEEMRSCKAAVGRVASLWATLGKTVCSTNTGAYCLARSKITWQAVRDICCQLAEFAEAIFDQQNADTDLEQHDVVADAQSVATSGRILLVDLVLGPYPGKQSGETALMWQVLDRLQAGDTLVAECYYCSYWIVAACKNKGVNIVSNQEQTNEDRKCSLF